jgi:glycosyltransferase involved in cell wall biosynthesis
VKKTFDNFLFVAVHAGAKEIDFPAEAEKRGLTDNFYNLPDQPPQALAGIYNMADIFCLPSHAEGMANVVLESMSSGLAVITTAVGGHPEIIETGVNGILVPPQQPAVLAEKLLEVVKDKGLRERLGKAAREFIVTKWGNYTDTAKVLYNKFEEALKA